MFSPNTKTLGSPHKTATLVKDPGQGSRQRSHLLSDETKLIVITVANAVGRVSVSGKPFLV